MAALFFLYRFDEMFRRIRVDSSGRIYIILLKCTMGMRM